MTTEPDMITEHETQTALMKVQHDIVCNLDSGRSATLVLLGTSAAYLINTDVFYKVILTMNMLMINK